MTVPLAYFALGTTTANLVNVELTLLSDPPHVPVDGGRVPFVGGVGSRAVDGALVRDGFLNGKWLLDIVSSAELFSFIYGRYSSYTVSSQRFYVSTLDESGNYSPYYVYLERPSTADNTVAVSVANGYWLTGALWNLTDCQIQSVSKTSSYSVTSSDHFIYADATSANVVLTLPDPTSVNAYVVYSAVLTATASSHTVSFKYSTTTYASTSTVYGRINVFSDGTNWQALTTP